MKVIQLIFCVIILLFAIRCAKQTTPTGGDKDTEPPVLIESNPPDRKTGFTKNEIELIFDEQVQINNAREQLLITPSIGKKFEAIARKNKVILKLNAPLSENTTYTLSFRESIQDLTEKNPAVNLKLAFSTGSYIDSLSIQGIVYSLLEGKPVKNYTVAVYPYSDTLNIFEHEASWITLTNEKGEYILDNLKAGSYFIYAFDDKSKNLIVESKTESFGFIAKPIELDTSLSNIDIPVIYLDSRPLKLISAKPLSSYFNIRLSKGVSSYEFIQENSNQELFSIIEDITTIKVFNPHSGLDSLLIQFKARDSIDQTIDTLFYIKFNQQSSSKDKLTSKLDEVYYYESSSELKTFVTFSKPISIFSYDSITIKLDSVNVLQFDSSDFKWEKNSTLLLLLKKLPKGISFTAQQAIKPRASRKEIAPTENNVEEKEPVKPLYNQLIIPNGTFISVESDSSSALVSPITTIKPETTGTILVDVKTSEKIIIELVSRTNKIFRTSYLHQSKFDNIPPGDYQIKVILDENGNGTWDPGNFFTKTEPEPILFYKNEADNQTVSIKANWELGPLLITPK